MSFNRKAKANVRARGLIKQRHYTMLLFIYLTKKIKNEELIEIENFYHNMSFSRQVLLTELRVLKNKGWIDCLFFRTRSGCRADYVNITLKDKAINLIEQVSKEDHEFEALREKLWIEINDYYSNDYL